MNEFHILFFLPEAQERIFERMMTAAKSFFLSADSVECRDWPTQRRKRKSKHTEVMKAATLRVTGEVPGETLDVARSLEDVLRTTLDSAKLGGAEVRVFAPDAVIGVVEGRHDAPVDKFRAANKSTRKDGALVTEDEV